MKSVKFFCLGCGLAVAGASPSLMATSLKAPDAAKDLELKLVGDLREQNFENACFLGVTSDRVKKILGRSSDSLSDLNESVKIGDVDFVFDSSKLDENKSIKHGVLMVLNKDKENCKNNLVLGDNDNNGSELKVDRGFLMGVEWKTLKYVNPKERTLIMHSGNWGDEKKFLFCLPYYKKENVQPKPALITKNSKEKNCLEETNCENLNNTKECEYGAKTNLRFNLVFWLGVSLGDK